MPKHRKRRIMLSIVSIVLFVVLSAQLSTFSFSVTAAGERGELVACWRSRSLRCRCKNFRRKP